MPRFIHSFTHSLIHSFTDSQVHVRVPTCDTRSQSRTFAKPEGAEKPQMEDRRLKIALPSRIFQLPSPIVVSIEWRTMNYDQNTSNLQKGNHRWTLINTDFRRKKP